MSEEATLDEFANADGDDTTESATDTETLNQEQFGPFTLSTPGEWSAKRLGDIKRLITRGKQPTYDDDGIPVINQECIYWDGWHFENLRYLDENVGEDWKDKYFAQRGDIILNSTGQGTLGRAQVYPDNKRRAIDSHVTLIRTEDDLNPHFHRYFFESHLGQALLYSMCVNGSTGQIELSKTRLDLQPVPLPPLSEQRKIATVLYTVDRAIEKTEAIIQQAKQAKEGVVKEIVTGGIDAEEYQTMRVGPHEFEIPHDWNVVSISESCENLDSERIPVSKSNREDMQGEIPYYGASGCVDYVDDYLFKEPLILLAEDGENLRSRTQRVAFKITGKSWVNNHAHVLRPKSGFELDYLVEYLERLDYRPYVSGSAQPKLNQTMLNKITVPKPPLEEQKEIASILNEFKNQISHETEYLDQLNRLKRGLMQDLLSGTVRTTDTNIEVPEEIEQYG